MCQFNSKRSHSSLKKLLDSKSLLKTALTYSVMTEEAKTEDADDLARFDELEQNFQKVIRTLSDDRSTDKFRAEYEKLHAVLLQSHEQNGKLMDKCRTLNNEIHSNANKVSSA
jgi:hypothetical protein